MNRRCLQNFCAAMMIVSILLRAAMATGLDTRAEAALHETATSADLARWTLYLESGRITDWPQDAEKTVRVWPLVIERETADEAVRTPDVDEPEKSAAAVVMDAPASGAAGFTDAQALSVGQSFTQMTKDAFDCITKILNGETLENDVIWTNLDIVTAENVNDLPYPEW